MASTFTNLLYHIVFSTKERRPLITPGLKGELYPYIGGVIRNQRGVLLDMNGMPDHVHLVVKLRPDPSVSDMLRLIKTNSSGWANERSDLTCAFAWQTGYSAFTVSESQLSSVRAYVQNQEEHHRKVSYKEELIALLKKHGIEYDERYIWD